MTDTIEIPSASSEPRRRSRLGEFFSRLIKEKPLGMFGGIVILLFIFVAIFADVLSPYPYDKNNLMEMLMPPSTDYLLGTDHAGRDLLSRLIFGARVSLTVGLASSCIIILLALLVGGAAGFIGGKVDLVIQRFIDGYMSFPALLLLLTVMTVVGRGLLQVIVVLGISYGISNSRIIRSAVLAVKANEYFIAAKAVGTPTLRILWRHVLPNIIPPLIIIFSINVGVVIMAEASLSFLGFGLPVNIPTWGGLLSREGREYMELAPWLALYPGLCLTIVVYSLNMFGDAMRDLLDPRLRGGQGSYGGTTIKRRGLFARLLLPEFKR